MRQGSGEVARQAALALCELELVTEPCEAARCLRSLKAHPDTDFDLKREADSLLGQWGLHQRSCEAAQ